MTAKLLFALSAGYWLGMNVTEWGVVIAAVPVVWFFIWKFRRLLTPLLRRYAVRREMERDSYAHQRLTHATSGKLMTIVVKGAKR